MQGSKGHVQRKRIVWIQRCSFILRFSLQTVYKGTKKNIISQVMKIPAGSANIDIRQHGYNNQKDDDNYLCEFSQT